jgi:hypothetical protein
VRSWHAFFVFESGENPQIKIPCSDSRSSYQPDVAGMMQVTLALLGYCGDSSATVQFLTEKICSFIARKPHSG